jgi:hypothetical protein
MQAISDGAAKRIATSAIETSRGLTFLAKYRVIYSLAGTIFMLGVIATVALWGAPLADVASLLPLVLLPPIMAQTIVPLARIQRAGMWRQASLLSGVGASVSLLAGFPLVLAFHNALGSVVQLVLTELIFALGLRVLATRALGALEPSVEGRDEDYSRSFVSASSFILSMQGQYQLDRVAVGWFGGPALLGSFNLGWSLSRSVSDSLSTSTLSVIQSKTLDGRTKTDEDLRAAIGSSLPHAVAVCTLTVAAVWVAARFIAPLVLGDEWSAMLDVVPLMSATAIPSVCSYCLIPALLYRKDMKWAVLPRLAGLGLSIGVGLSVQYSLAIAVGIALLRELLSMGVMMLGLRSVVTRRMVLLPLGATAVACGGVYLADAVLLAVS